MSDKPRRLSMVRSYTPADFFTLANASCGTISIFLCLSYIADPGAGAGVSDVRSRYLWGPSCSRSWRSCAMRWTATSRGATRDDSRRLAPTSIRSRISSRLAWRRRCLDTHSDYEDSGTCSSDLLRLCRNQPTGPIQRHGFVSDERRDREGALLRRDAHSHQRGPGPPAGRRLLPGTDWREFPGGQWELLAWTLHPFSLLFFVSGSLMISTLKVPKP